MRSVGHHAVAAPPGPDLEALTNRLLALRTEIDAILEQLVLGPSAAAPATAAQFVEEPLLIDADISDAFAAPAIEPDCLGHAITESSVRTPDEPWTQATAIEEQCVEPIEAMQTPAEPHSAMFTDAIAVDETPAPPSPSKDEQEPAVAEANQVVMVAEAETELAPPPDIAAADMDADGAHPIQSDGAETPEWAACQEPAGAAVLEPPAAPVRSEIVVPLAFAIDMRKREKSKELPIAQARPAVGPRHRQLAAARIAASLLALLAAVTVVSFADRTAFGSVRSLSWAASPRPNLPTTAGWSAWGRPADGEEACDQSEATNGRPVSQGDPYTSQQAWPASP
jgi:hypothetical protein